MANILDLGDTQIAGAGLRFLNPEQLGFLSLEDSRYDDSAIDDLLSAVSPHAEIVVAGTQMTKAGITRLQSARPYFKVQDQ